MPRKLISLSIAAAITLAIVLTGCGKEDGADNETTFTELISRAGDYNGKTVTLDAFYFSGFEIAVIAGRLEASPYGNRMVPAGELVWITGSGISKAVLDGLYTQTDTPSGYPERFGKIRVTGNFETGSRYGHMDAYNYLLTITGAELLDWMP